MKARKIENFLFMKYDEIQKGLTSASGWKEIEYVRVGEASYRILGEGWTSICEKPIDQWKEWKLLVHYWSIK